MLNERCNLRCQGCGYWRLPHYRTELGTREWLDALTSLREFLGPFHINFSGGEPLLRRDLAQILNHCRDHRIRAGLTTNGVLLKDRQAIELVEARLFTLNVSIDGATARTHDLQRGVEGSFEKAMRAIDLIQSHAQRCRITVPIILKPVVSRLNLEEMPALVSLAREMGCSVLMQPVSDWGCEETQSMWIDDFERLEAIVTELVALAQAGGPILNTAAQMADWARHFRGEPAAVRNDVGCTVGLDTLIILADGELHNCYKTGSLGNVKDGAIRELWHAEGAREHRKRLVDCTRGCTESCAVKRPLAQQVKGAMRLLRG